MPPPLALLLLLLSVHGVRGQWITLLRNNLTILPSNTMSPNCSFRFLSESCQGPEINGAELGQKICLHFACAEHWFRVQDCKFVNVGSLQVVDSNGCGDRDIDYPSPVYDFRRKTSQLIVSTPKFENSQQVTLQCSLRLCNPCTCPQILPLRGCHDIRDNVTLDIPPCEETATSGASSTTPRPMTTFLPRSLSSSESRDDSIVILLPLFYVILHLLLVTLYLRPDDWLGAKHKHPAYPLSPAMKK